MRPTILVILIVVIMLVSWYICANYKESFVPNPAYRDYMSANPRAGYAQFREEAGGDIVDYEFSKYAKKP